MEQLIQALTAYTSTLEQKLSALEARVAQLEEANEAMKREGDETKALITTLQTEVTALATTAVLDTTNTEEPEVEIELIITEEPQEQETPEEPIEESVEKTQQVMQKELETLDIINTLVDEEPTVETTAIEEPAVETTTTEEPTNETTAIEELAVETTATEEPTNETTAIEEPVDETTTSQEPVDETIVEAEPTLLTELEVEPIVEVKVKQPTPRPVPQQTSLFGPAVDDIRQAITLGDRFLFQRELFAGNGELMQKTLDELNTFCSFDEAIEYMSENFEWDTDSTVVKLFENVLRRRFN
jgi:hypothetical protein